MQELFVIVSGKIVNLCPVGCYFFMHDEEGNQVYVDLAPQNFDVPQSALGEQVEVWGLGSMSGGAPKVSAYKVIFPNIDQQNIDTQSLDRIPEKSIIDEIQHTIDNLNKRPIVHSNNSRRILF